MPTLAYVVRLRPIADQPADFGKFARVIDGGQRMTRRQRDDQCATIGKEWIDRDQQCGAGLLRETCESRHDVAIAIAGVKDFDRHPQGWNARMHVLDSGVGQRSVGSDERDETGRLRRQLTQQSEPLRGELHVEVLTPVALPPGRLRLATRPSATGSEAVLKTIGMLEVAALAASAPAVLSSTTITATCRRTRSAANSGIRSSRPPAQRNSIATLRPSTYPVSLKPLRNASRRLTLFSAELPPINPITGTAGCCARAASGQAAPRRRSA